MVREWYRSGEGKDREKTGQRRSKNNIRAEDFMEQICSFEKKIVILQAFRRFKNYTHQQDNESDDFCSGLGHTPQTTN